MSGCHVFPASAARPATATNNRSASVVQCARLSPCGTCLDHHILSHHHLFCKCSALGDGAHLRMQRQAGANRWRGGAVGGCRQVRRCMSCQQQPSHPLCLATAHSALLRTMGALSRSPLLLQHHNKRTLSPALTVRTSRPHSTTVPLHSLPGTNGSLGRSWYSPCSGDEGRRVLAFRLAVRPQLCHHLCSVSCGELDNGQPACLLPPSAPGAAARLQS